MTFSAESTDVCPHCKTGVRFEKATVTFVQREWEASQLVVNFQSRAKLHLDCCSCPVCGEAILCIRIVADRLGRLRSGPGLVFPAGSQRPLPAEVHASAPEFAQDFAEAVAVLPMSRKACAALARRCLQNILTHGGKAKKRDLADQIAEILPTLPLELAFNVDAIRQVGNFAAHPIKSTNSGAIADVEDNEAEWILDVLEELADYYYVAPAQAAKKRDALNTKLAGLGKPPLKTP